MPIPKDWRCAKQDPKWKEAMKEELLALQKNKTWEFVHLPEGKKAVGCKWVFTVKQTPEGKWIDIRQDWSSHMELTMMKPLHQWQRWVR